MNLENSKYAWMANWVSKLPPGEAYLARKSHTEEEGTFTCEPGSFRGVVYEVAKAKGWKATVSVFEAEVVFAFYRADSYLRPNMPAYPVVKRLRGE